MPSSGHIFKIFLATFAVSFLAIILLTAVFNVLVDPYGLFGTDRIEGLNMIKPSASKHVRLAKPYQATRAHPKTVIGGNSRPEMGLNPLSGCWPDQMLPVFNFGLPGANIHMQSRTLQHAISDSSVKYVLWGLDFVDFLNRFPGSPKASQLPEARLPIEDRLKVNADGSENGNFEKTYLVDYLSTAFSLDSVKDSLFTLAAQRRPQSSTIREDGFNPAAEYRDIVAWEGQSVLFRQKNRDMARSFSRPGLKVLQPDVRWSSDFESVKNTIRIMQDRDIILVIFINPYHAEYLSLIHLAGLWSEFETWKRKLVEVAAEFDLEVWDFSGINRFSSENEPAPGDKRTTLAWFGNPRTTVRNTVT